MVTKEIDISWSSRTHVYPLVSNCNYKTCPWHFWKEALRHDPIHRRGSAARTQPQFRSRVAYCVGKPYTYYFRNKPSIFCIFEPKVYIIKTNLYIFCYFSTVLIVNVNNHQSCLKTFHHFVKPFTDVVTIIFLQVLITLLRIGTYPTHKEISSYYGDYSFHIVHISNRIWLFQPFTLEL